jgi:hypothetical protein
MILVRIKVVLILVNLVYVLMSGVLKMRHLLGFLLLLEMGILLGLFILGEVCPFGWGYLRVLFLVMGVAEAGLGLSVVVKVSRSRGQDRVFTGGLIGGD